MDVTHYQAKWSGDMPHWISLLLIRVAAIGVRQTARELGVAHALISLVLHRKTPGPTLRRRVLEQWGVIECKPYGESISIDRCEQRQKVPCPTHNPMAMPRWIACRQCPNNPKSKEKEDGNGK